MAEQTIVLRFRDFFPGVDTIDAHNEICRRKGAVLWGWWKKEHEPDRITELMDIDMSSPLTVLLLNRLSRTAFQARCVAILSSSKGARAYIPPYYRPVARRVHAWFRFEGQIDPAEYDEELAESLGEHTLRLQRDIAVMDESDYVLVTKSEPEDGKSAIASGNVTVLGGAPRRKVRLLHLSDLHFAPDDHNFAFPGVSGVDSAQVSLAEAVQADYIRNFEGSVNGLILSGDITSKAAWDEPLLGSIVAEIRKLVDLLKIELADVVVCPGNHDFKRPEPAKMEDAADITVREAISFPHEKDFRIFRNQLLGIAVDKPLATVFSRDCDGFVLKVGVLNSANLARTEFVEYGFVGDALNGVLKEMRCGTEKAYKILVLHHHLIPISPIEEPKKLGVSVTLDAHSILSRAQQEGVQLVLHGHQHIPKIVKTSQAWQVKGKWQGLEEDIFILASGSAGSKWLGPGISNTYSIVDFCAEGVEVHCRRLNRLGGVGSEEFAINLPIAPKFD